MEIEVQETKERMRGNRDEPPGRTAEKGREGGGGEVVDVTLSPEQEKLKKFMGVGFTKGKSLGGAALPLPRRAVRHIQRVERRAGEEQGKKTSSKKTT